MPRCAWPTLVLALAGLWSAPGTAWGYVRELTSTGQPIAWRYPCVNMEIGVDALPPVLTAADVTTAATQAMAAWSYPQVACTDFRLSLVTIPAAAAKAGYDKQNVIVFRQDNWCRESVLPDDEGGELPSCYPSTALAVTSVFKNKKTGEILDADIEFNAVDHPWGDLEGQPALALAETVDFQNALTHELGHVVGLDHNCYTGADGATRPLDNTGMPAVDCYGSAPLPAAVADATMYPSVVLSDTTRRTLTEDDTLGVCEIYPHAHETCPPPASEGGCSLGPAPKPSRRAWPALLGGLLVLALTVASLPRARRGLVRILRRSW